jgi:AcrR family transcriptional regulator
MMAARRGTLPAGHVQGTPRPLDDSAPATRARVLQMQRSRLLSAALTAVEEHGYADTTVAHIIGRARVSRRTFYDLFEDREACLLATLEDAVAQVAGELHTAELDGLAWRERVRTGLWRILCFFDREPELARLCVVQSLRGSQRVLERREQILLALADVIDEGRHESSRGRERSPLIAEGVVGAALAILHTRLLRRDPQALGDLLGELMGLIVLPYLGSAAARRERTRPLPAPPMRETNHSFAALAQHAAQAPPGELPMRLTYRTARVLENVAEYPGASNRVLAGHAGIADQGQVSKLLARLQRLGLVQNTGEGHTKGEPNAWQLTPIGVQVTQGIRGNTRYPQQAA